MIHDYWTTLRGSRLQPCRTDFNPGAVPDALGDTFILTLDTEGHFPYRIAGSRICTLFGHDMQGLSFMAPFDAEARAHLTGIILSVKSRGCVTELSLNAYTRDNKRAELGLVFLPLSSSCKNEGRMLGAMAPKRPIPWIGTERITKLTVSQLDKQPTPSSPDPGNDFRDMKLSLRLIQGGMSDS